MCDKKSNHRSIALYLKGTKIRNEEQDKALLNMVYAQGLYISLAGIYIGNTISMVERSNSPDKMKDQGPQIDKNGKVPKSKNG